jgi:hypothetical protein
MYNKLHNKLEQFDHDHLLNSEWCEHRSDHRSVSIARRDSGLRVRQIGERLVLSGLTKPLSRSVEHQLTESVISGRGGRPVAPIEFDQWVLGQQGNSIFVCLR